MQQRFLHSAPKEINQEGPHHQCEVLSFRNFRQLQDQIDVIKILRSPSKRGLAVNLSLRNKGRNFEGYLQGKPDAASPLSQFASRSLFWEDVALDLPSLLTEGDYGDPYFSTVPQIPKINDQMLSQHPAYSQFILVRDTFQSTARKDGKNSGPFSYEHVIDPMYQAFY